MAVTLFRAKKLDKYKQQLQRRGMFRNRPYKRSVNFDSNELESDLLSGNFSFGHFEKEGDDKFFYMCTSLKDEVVLQSLNKVIKGLYKVRQADRNLMVKQMLSLLQEKHEKYIYRLDIKNFYERICLFKSIKKLIDDGLLASEYEHAIWSFFNQIKSELQRVSGTKGLPRGLSISATLSEIFMRDFDNAVKRIDGVYYYARYVDDIIIFSTTPLKISESLNPLLPDGLEFNIDKNKSFNVSFEKCKKKCTCKNPPHSMDFLGYKFSFYATYCKAKKDQSRVNIGLSANKTARFKRRLHNSFWHYRKFGKKKLLIKRLKFLTNSFAIDQNKADSDTLYSGLYYNYQRMNDETQLAELDKLLYYYINLSPEYSNFHIDNNLKNQLSEFSFIKGFRTRSKEKFTPRDIRKIKGVWSEL